MPSPARPTPEPAVDASELLGPLLRTLAESLDVREIFARISAEARRVIPHDFLMLGLLSEDHQRVRVMALSGEMPDTPGDVGVPLPLRLAIEEEAFVLADARLVDGGAAVEATLRMPGHDGEKTVRYEAQPLFRQLVLRHGLHSFMRIAVRLRGGVLGGLIFCATSNDGFSHADVARARQIADCVALAVAHQRLAEEEQRSAEARERASRLEVRVLRLTEELEAQGRHRTLGGSTPWRDVLRDAAKVAATEATVLLTGESGTGKEVIARFIHRGSPRAEGPFVALNCAALPEQLMESELFGHEKGAFTGAHAAHAGKIEQAAGGVLFLDEVGEMSPPLQARFLRVLQEREFQRLGSARTQKADVRVIAATNRDLKAAIAQGDFREDLYYRLAVFELALPPLRKRPDDIPLLAQAFLDEIGRQIGRPAAGFASEVRTRLAAYAWPGNVRELRNVIERAVILCEGGTVTAAHLPIGLAMPVSDAGAPGATRREAPTLDATEREMIAAALAQAGNNKSKAARMLGLTRAQLRSRLEKHRLNLD